MDTNYGQIAYEAYCQNTGGVSLVSGQKLPAWSALKPEIQNAWGAAIEAVLDRFILALPHAPKTPAIRKAKEDFEAIQRRRRAVEKARGQQEDA